MHAHANGFDEGTVQLEDVAHAPALGHICKIEHHPGRLAFQCECFWTIGPVKLHDDLLAVRRENEVLDLLQLRRIVGKGQAEHEQQDRYRP